MLRQLVVLPTDLPDALNDLPTSRAVGDSPASCNIIWYAILYYNVTLWYVILYHIVIYITDAA